MLPTEIDGIHWQCDIREALYALQWDLIIAHPPCTYLCNSGVRWLVKDGEFDKERYRRMILAKELFDLTLNHPCAKIVNENPVPHKYANLPKYSQIIQPYEHGDGYTKKTCLWVKGLPLLKPSNVVEGRIPETHKSPDSKDRAKKRSRTYPGVALAFAEQWG